MVERVRGRHKVHNGIFRAMLVDDVGDIRAELQYVAGAL